MKTGSDTLALVAAKAFWIIAPPRIHAEGIGCDLPHRLEIVPSARPRTNGEGALKPPVEMLVRSRSDLSHASVMSREPGYGESESFRQTHHTPPIRAAHKTTKAESVNMSPAENLRSAFQVN
ncbi:MAG: hypothetical protein WCC08_15700 [Terrimicrobiaceae bacterium]